MREIALTRGYVALVDDEDYESLLTYKWFSSTQGGSVYALARINRNPMSMALFLMGGAREGMRVDHRDHDGLNNQRFNLRWATISQNAMNAEKSKANKSGVKRVCFAPRENKWRAYIVVKGKQISGGYHMTLEAASQASARLAEQFHGEFAR